MRKLGAIALLAGSVSLSACVVAPPTGPEVVAMPGGAEGLVRGQGMPQSKTQ